MLGMNLEYVDQNRLNTRVVNDLRFSFWMHNARGFDSYENGDIFWKMPGVECGKSTFCRANFVREAFLFLKRWHDPVSSPELHESKHPAFVRYSFI